MGKIPICLFDHVASKDSFIGTDQFFKVWKLTFWGPHKKQSHAGLEC